MPAYRTRETSSRTLEVATDAPLPPTVAIISPTPRAFTFPINAIPDARFVSPSSSPFEPDLKFACTPPPARALSPTSSIGSTDASSIFSTPSARSSQASHKRRRSTASDIGERRPKKGDDDYIKRPENAFILFRRKCCEDRQAQDETDDGSAGPVKKQRQADLSKTISQQWKSLAAEERHYWEELAKEKKKEHEAMYPNYVYRPQRLKDKSKARKGKGRKEGEQETDAESGISFVIPVPSPPRSLSRDSLPLDASARGRRAVSAPTPPPQYQTIQLPSVYMPSCPTSPSLNPSLMPRISRRSPHIPPPGNDSLTHFEYLPNDSLFPPYQHQHSAFEHSPQADQLFQMFQLEQSTLSGQSGAPLLHPLSIPRDSSSMPSSLVSPAESIASNHFLSPVSPASTQGGPYTPAESLSMMSLSLANNTSCGQPMDAMSDHSSGPLAFSMWPQESLWPDDAMIPDDFDLNSIPPIELGISQFDGEMHQLAALPELSEGMDIPGFEFDDAFALGQGQGQEHDLHDADPGHDPFDMFGGYDHTTGGNIAW